MMHDWSWGWGGGMLFGPFFMIAGPVLLIVLVIVLARWMTADAPSDRIRTPREILDERFAKGEIQRDEYEERRKALAG